MGAIYVTKESHHITLEGSSKRGALLPQVEEYPGVTGGLKIASLAKAALPGYQRKAQRRGRWIQKISLGKSMPNVKGEPVLQGTPCVVSECLREAGLSFLHSRTLKI